MLGLQCCGAVTSCPTASVQSLALGPLKCIRTAGWVLSALGVDAVVWEKLALIPSVNACTVGCEREKCVTNVFILLSSQAENEETRERLFESLLSECRDAIQAVREDLKPDQVSTKHQRSYI